MILDSYLKGQLIYSHYDTFNHSHGGNAIIYYLPGW
jgi:hypothetical protein